MALQPVQKVQLRRIVSVAHVSWTVVNVAGTGTQSPCNTAIHACMLPPLTQADMIVAPASLTCWSLF